MIKLLVEAGELLESELGDDTGVAAGVNTIGVIGEESLRVRLSDTWAHAEPIPYAQFQTSIIVRNHDCESSCHTDFCRGWEEGVHCKAG